MIKSLIIKKSKTLSENADFEPDLVLLPETFNSGYNARFEILSKTQNPFQMTQHQCFISMAVKYNTNIAGTIIENATTLRSKILLLFLTERAHCVQNIIKCMFFLNKVAMKTNI